MTVVVQIGNSDNKLDQLQWSLFCRDIKEYVRRNSETVHFQGGSEWDKAWQNACFVCEVEDRFVSSFVNGLKPIREAYSQDSVAVLTGITRFV
jgi:hypothetical protein